MTTGKRANLRQIRGGAWLVLLSLFLACHSKSQEPSTEPPSTIYFVPAWSPDGSEIISEVERHDDPGNVSYHIAVFDATTGEVRRERPLDIPTPFGFSWTPDGAWVLFGAGSGIFKMSSDLQTVIQLTSGQFLLSPSFSKARNLVFFTKNDGAIGGLFSVTLDGDSLRRWSTATSYVLRTYCFPNNSDSLVGYDANQSPVRLIVFDPDSIENATVLVEELYGVYPCRVSTSGRYIAYDQLPKGSRSPSIWMIDRSTNTRRQLVSGVGEGIDFSPDGRKMVYPGMRREGGLWIMDIETGERNLLENQEWQ